MTENKFEWTDELVAKYGDYYKGKQGVDYSTWGKCIMEAFKKEHTPVSVVEKDYEQDTEVLDSYTNTYYRKLYDGFWTNGSQHNFTIHAYEIGESQRYHLTDRKPQKKILGTTQDGKVCYEGDTFLIWRLLSNWDLLEMRVCDTSMPDPSNYFADKQKADEYIFTNQPIPFSYKEVCDIIKDVADNATGYNNKSYLRERFRSLFKSKINQP